MTKDTIYTSPKNPVPPFEFNQDVALVFDDMILRSVPQYLELLKRQTQFVEQFYKDNTKVYDLGCSTGNLGISLCQTSQKAIEMVAVDNSQPMLDMYQKRLFEIKDNKRDLDINIEFLCQSIDEVSMRNASVVVLNFTLQFLPLAKRETLLKDIYNALIPGGILLFSEKISHPDANMSNIWQTFYYQFKKENGYSELEISQKREALENVLIPETIDEHKQRLLQCGFSQIDIWLKWFNFMSMVCIK